MIDTKDVEERATLLPCPFCGGSAELILPTVEDRWSQVSCKVCGGRGCEWPGSPDKAIASWNARPASAPPASAARQISVNGLANDTLFALKGLYGAENDPHRDGDAIGIISKPLNDLTQECLAGMREIAALRQELEARTGTAGREEIARAIYNSELGYQRAEPWSENLFDSERLQYLRQADAVLALSTRQDSHPLKDR